MSNVQVNIAKVKELKAQLESHCMAARIKEDRNQITVIFPCGFMPQGVRVTMANGKAWAYEKAIAKMEQVWLESLQGFVA